MKVLHISDVHVKNFKYHKQYSEIFESLYEKARELKPDIIINTGDTAHTKLEISPSFVEMTAKFFESLSSIAPLHIILGNHDLNLTNKDRQDAITPIVDALKNPNIILHKYSEKFTLFDDFNFHVLSIVDEENWDLNVDETKTNIALFHGSVKGSQTDKNFTMTHGDIEFSVLEKFDYALLGDIHKTNQSLDFAGHCRYPGSLIQQNHGETNDKGFLLWDIKGKEDYHIEHVQLLNPYPFCTIELTEEGKVPSNASVPLGARLRLLSSNNLSTELMKKASDVAKDKFKPESISFLTRNVNRADNVVGDKISAKENLRNQKVQEKLMAEYLKDFSLSDDMLQHIFEINNRYNIQIQSVEEVGRNIDWKLKSVEWDNLFNYADGNSIDFSKLSGVVGIFGKNYSGKSSIIDSILYSIFNTTSKNERKTTNVINQTKQSGRGKVVIEVDDLEYHIERKAEKYTKKLKGETTEEAKTELALNLFDPVTNQWEQMNELSRTDTDKRIRKIFGTIDDFMLTSFSSQMDSMSFIRDGSTHRKEILARFLDLDIFDAKFKIAKEESANIKGLLKKIEGKDYNSAINENEGQLSQLNETIYSNAAESEKLKINISDIKEQISNLNSCIKAHTKECGIEATDIENVLNEKQTLSQNLENLNTELLLKQGESDEAKSLLSKMEEFFKNFDIKELKGKKDFIVKKQTELKNLHSDISTNKKDAERLNLKIKLLSEIPCGTSFPTCKFLKDAYEAKKQIPAINDSIKEDGDKHSKVSKEIEDFDASQLDSQISKYEQIVLKKAETEKKSLKLQIDINRIEKEIGTSSSRLVIIENTLEIFRKNNELFSKIDNLKTEEIVLNKELNLASRKFEKLDKETIESYIKIGSLTNKVETLKTEKQELDNYRDEFAAYDYYMRCMHANGISYEIIKKKLPVINMEISKVLSNIVDFEVYFEDDGTKLNVFIKHPKYDPRPIEMGSGAEKTIAAIAIRLAFLQVSNLPRANFIVLDEPGTALDGENIEGLTRILEMAKSCYDVVLLISHMDALKDIVDQIIIIEKKDGYAYVSI